MVTAFNRSFSLPGSPRRRTRSASAQSYHTRSVSLPCQSHPLISNLQDHILSLATWQNQNPKSVFSISNGLTRLENLHVSFNDFLLHHNGFGSESITRVLEDFLCLLDLQNIFIHELFTLRELQYEAQVAIRHNDSSKIESCVKSMKKTEKQITKLAVSLQNILKHKSIEDGEIKVVVREVVGVTVSVLQVVFLESAGLVSALCGAKNYWLRSLKNGEEFRKGDMMGKLVEMEEFGGEIEAKSENLFRCLVNVRVSLLNIVSGQ